MTVARGFHGGIDKFIADRVNFSLFLGVPKSQQPPGERRNFAAPVCLSQGKDQAVEGFLIVGIRFQRGLALLNGKIGFA